jgi:hypothetical protein
MLGVLPKGPGIGPNSTLPHGSRSRDRNRPLPFKVGAATSVSDGGGTRHDEYEWFSGLG